MSAQRPCLGELAELGMLARRTGLADSVATARELCRRRGVETVATVRGDAADITAFLGDSSDVDLDAEVTTLTASTA